MVETIELRIPSEPKFLKIVRTTVNYICETMGFSRDEMNNVTLAVDEACSNVIKHAYGGKTDQPIQVICNIYDDRLEVVLRDFGKQVNLNEIKSRELNDLRPGGLGVHLIKSVMDVVNYDNRFEQGNQLQLIKYIRRKG